jgi:hypothetical protein
MKTLYEEIEKVKTASTWNTELHCNGELQEKLELTSSQVEYLCEVMRDLAIMNGELPSEGENDK